jgi:hypothetical protein
MKESQKYILGMSVKDLSLKDITEELTDCKRDLKVIEDYEQGKITYSELRCETMFEPSDKEGIILAIEELTEEKKRRQ